MFALFKKKQQQKIFQEEVDDSISRSTSLSSIILQEGKSQQNRLPPDSKGMTLGFVGSVWEKLMTFHDQENTQIVIFISWILGLAIGGSWIMFTTIAGPLSKVTFRPIKEAVGEEVVEEPVFTLDMNQTLSLWALLLTGGLGFYLWMKFCYCRYLRD
ncbi:hypothetical protein HRE53_31025 (plasmid) [Acaryochloris sp. 'Moss Beach']|uniref:hypothetical protein n=1 Tax=Acaryochloris sp. 'Moss Beach' TaxID=2740837 RepID=UPI001F1DDE04|nr:hypothetical protein [Acaryochloris sp. 'Moss Beach']UJB73141.1 hypothetical protein HRE53_31025 [Acaryochloris sp. 'Moss Beach']